jgi:heptosyltransferase-3
MKILLIRRDNIGDMICTLPLLSSLSVALRRAEIDVLTNSYVAPILSDIGYIKNVFLYQKLKHQNLGKLRTIWQSIKTYFAIRRNLYDYIICVSSRDLALSMTLKTKQRVAYDKSIQGVFKYLKIAAVPWCAESHEVMRVWLLGGPLGLTVESPPARTPQLAPFYPRVPGGKELRIAIQLSARKTGQRWPIEKYYELVSRLSESGYAVSVLWAPGSQTNRRHPGDDDNARHLACRIDSSKVNFVRTLDLASLVRELRKCQFIVSPDGGASHIAAALDLRSVVLFGNSEPAHWAPWTDGNFIIKGLNNRVDTISVESVLKGLEKISELQISLPGGL